MATQRHGSDRARAYPNRPAASQPAETAPLRPATPAAGAPMARPPVRRPPTPLSQPTIYGREDPYARRAARRPPPRRTAEARKKPGPHRVLRVYTVIVALVAGIAIMLALHARDAVAGASRRDVSARANATAWRATATQLLRRDRILERRLNLLTARYNRVARDLRDARAASAAAAAAAAAPPPAPSTPTPAVVQTPAAPTPAPTQQSSPPVSSQS